MSTRRIHYESAFEEYLRGRGVPYVAVDDAKKAVFGEISLKSFDFIVYSEVGPNLLVDVKGRKFPDSTPGGKKTASRAWENWITQDDVAGLRDWARVFGEGFLATLVFAYWLQGPPARAPFEDVHRIQNHYYAFMAIGLEEYLLAARTRSRRWQTLSMPTAAFRKAIRPLSQLLEHEAV